MDRVLLHTCCAPCANRCIDALQKENIEVLSINRQYKYGDENLTMVCTLYCIENIGIEIPMSGVPIDKKD